MRITNRTDQTLTIRTSAFRGTASNPYIVWTWKGPRGYVDQGQGQDAVYVSVARGKINASDFWAFDSNRLTPKNGERTYPNTHSVLVVNGGRGIVDWSVVRDKYIYGAGSISGGGGPADSAVAQSLKAASAVFAALATAFSATGKGGALPAGVFSLVSSMLAFGEEDPPPPPKLGEIEAVVERVVERVVEEQFQKHVARDAAITFLGAQDWLLGQERAFRSAQKRKGDPKPGDEKNREERASGFIDELKGWGDPSRDLKHQMDLLRSEPETAKWIIPAFIAGIGAYLQIARLYALEKSSREGISVTTIEDYQAEVDSSRNSLTAASDAWHRYCDAILRKESIHNTPEGAELKHAVTRAYAGTDDIGPLLPTKEIQAEVLERIDPTPIGRALWSLKQAHKYLAEDLTAMKQGKPPTHFWSESWSREELTAP